MFPEWSGMEDKRSGDDVTGISAILLRASRLAEAILVLVWTGRKPERAGDPRPPKPKEGGKPQRSQVSQGEEAALDSALQGIPTAGKGLVSSSLQSLPAACLSQMLGGDKAAHSSHCGNNCRTNIRHLQVQKWIQKETMTCPRSQEKEGRNWAGKFRGCQAEAQRERCR